jgi:hypothetical protein
MGTISLTEYVEQVKNIISDFKAHWKEGQKSGLNFPEKLSPGDWDEQFIAFIENYGE